MAHATASKVVFYPHCQIWRHNFQCQPNPGSGFCVLCFHPHSRASCLGFFGMYSAPSLLVSEEKEASHSEQVPLLPTNCGSVLLLFLCLVLWVKKVLSPVCDTLCGKAVGVTANLILSGVWPGCVTDASITSYTDWIRLNTSCTKHRGGLCRIQTQQI